MCHARNILVEREREVYFFTCTIVASVPWSVVFFYVINHIKKHKKALGGRGTNHQTDHHMVSDYRRSWTPATPEESQARCRPFKVLDEKQRKRCFTPVFCHIKNKYQRLNLIYCKVLNQQDFK